MFMSQQCVSVPIWGEKLHKLSQHVAQFTDIHTRLEIGMIWYFITKLIVRALCHIHFFVEKLRYVKHVGQKHLVSIQLRNQNMIFISWIKKKKQMAITATWAGDVWDFQKKHCKRTHWLFMFGIFNRNILAIKATLICSHEVFLKMPP